MKDGRVHGWSSPSACARAMTAVAASSTTPYPSSSRHRRIDVLPAPGVPVRTYRRMIREPFLAGRDMLTGPIGPPTGGSGPNGVLEMGWGTQADPRTADVPETPL